MTHPVVADTGGLLRALARAAGGAPAWPDYEHALRAPSRVFVPSTILPEVDYFLRDERAAMRKFVAELLDPATTYELVMVTPDLLVRALYIDAKFATSSCGLVDCSVAAVAEHLRVYRVLTTDRRDFSVIRVGPHFRRALTIVP